MSAFDNEMAALDAAIFDGFGDPAIYVHTDPNTGEDPIETTVIVDEEVIPESDGYTEIYNQVLMATIPNLEVKVKANKQSLVILEGRHKGTYDIVKIEQETPSEVLVRIA